jgi:nucleotidyltransferase substrate binding protein (TIGR01987 family)
MSSPPWHYKYRQYCEALAQLEEAVTYFQETAEAPNPIVRDGLIKRFELVFELAWKTLQAWLLEQGFERREAMGPKQALKQGLNVGLIEARSEWDRMNQDRNLAAHIYDAAQAQAIATRIGRSHILLLQALREQLR